jgi:dipeptidyl aminopeptidase/acylaminoacyl peptidase
MQVLYTLTSRTFDPNAEMKPDDRSGGWTVDTQLFVVDVQGGTPRQLTFGEEWPTSPRWAPDRTAIAFLRPHGGRKRIHVLPMEGGEPRLVDTGDLEPTRVEWSPAGGALAFTASLPETPEERRTKWETGGVERYDEEWRSEQLFVMDLPDGEPRRITVGLGHVTEFDWAPDGGHVAVITSPSSNPYLTFSRATPRIVCAADCSLRGALETVPGIYRRIRWSPDGSRVAYLKAAGTLSMMNELVVREVNGDGRWNAAAGMDPSIADFVWLTESGDLLAHVLERTSSRLYRLKPDGSGTACVDDGSRVIRGGLHVDAEGGHVACLASTPTTSDAPAVFDLHAGRWREAVQVNPEVRDWALGTLELVHWKNPEGQEIEGLLWVTPRAEADRAPPLMVLPHGGPDWVSLAGFSAWAHYFGARGLSVFQPNYRGGIAYGYEHYAANRGRLGEIEWADIESGVDHLIATGRADPERLVIGGWSWGGYLTAWAIGHTDRYQAAVAGAAVADVVSQYGLSDINYGVVGLWEYRGNPWQQAENFDRANPLRFVQHATTPTLILHGKDDRRVPFASAQILYRALWDVGCEVRCYAYPGEGHGIRQPAHVVHLLEAWADWYLDHLPEEE